MEISSLPHSRENSILVSLTMRIPTMTVTQELQFSTTSNPVNEMLSVAVLATDLLAIGVDGHVTAFNTDPVCQSKTPC